MEKRVEDVASEVMGAIRATQAKVHGQSGVFELLTREHGELLALFIRLQESADVQLRRELFPKLRAELLAHEKGELSEVYPALRKRVELATFAEEHEVEARDLEETVDELAAMSYEDENWGAKFEELVDRARAHVQEEESDFFPTASDVLGPETTEVMKTRYLEKKKALLAGRN